MVSVIAKLSSSMLYFFLTAQLLSKNFFFAEVVINTKIIGIHFTRKSTFKFSTLKCNAQFNVFLPFLCNYL